MATTSRADFLKHWQELVDAILANPALMYMEESRLNLTYHIDQIRSKTVDQAILRARMQEKSRELEAHVKAGKDLATRLHDGVRMQYGRRSEKLAEFRLQPFRGTKTEPATVPQGVSEEMEEDISPEPGPNPAPSTTPGTDASIQQ